MQIMGLGCMDADWQNRRIKLEVQVKAALAQFQQYECFVNNLAVTRRFGCYRYQQSDSTRMTVLPSGTQTNWYWNIFNEACCLDKRIDYVLRPSLKSNKFILNKIVNGTWTFNHKMVDNLLKFILTLSKQVKSEEHFAVLMPHSRKIDREAFPKYMNLFEKSLSDKNIPCSFVFSNLVDKNKKNIIFVIDLVSTPVRQANVLKKLERLCPGGIYPIYFSMMKILNSDEGKMAAQICESQSRRPEDTDPLCDEETSITKSL